MSLSALRILRRVASGGVDQHGLVGEPPVAGACSANAGHRLGVTRTGKRKIQARIDQRRRLACAGRADDDVPGDLIEEVALAARPLERRHGLVHAGLEHLRVVIPVVVVRNDSLELLSAPFAFARNAARRRAPAIATITPMIVARSQTGPSGRVSAKRINGPANQTAAAKPASAITLNIRSSQRVMGASNRPCSQCFLLGDHHIDTAVLGAAFRRRIVGDRLVLALAIDR